MTNPTRAAPFNLTTYQFEKNADLGIKNRVKSIFYCIGSAILSAASIVATVYVLTAGLTPYSRKNPPRVIDIALCVSSEMMLVGLLFFKVFKDAHPTIVPQTEIGLEPDLQW